jgi:DNA-binding NtrC family response regulator
MKSVLIIDDDKNVLNALHRLLRSGLYKLTLCQNPEEALLLCNKNSYSLIISDQKMPVVTGTQFFKKIINLQPTATKIILSGYSDFNEVVSAFNDRLIHQFISKPWDDEALHDIVNAAVASVVEDSAPPKKEAIRDNDGLLEFHGLLSSDINIQNLFKKIERAAHSGAPIYLYGETGSGKELFAKAIHNEGSNASGPFIAINCANFNEQLMESQLFGHVKGAFTGADSNQQGLLSAANGGTLFLDEVVTLPTNMQAKLLRVLQEKEYMPVGSTEKITADVTIVSASNKHLSLAVAEHEFREDLYYRLCVIPLHIPPLRDRGNDIVKLFRFYLHQFSANKHFRLDDFGKLISSYRWPGNVRQLINTCQYVAAMSESDAITIADLPEDILGDYQVTASKVEAHDLTGDSIKQTLLTHDNNKSAAARALGVSRMTLWRKIKELDID